MVLLLLGKQMAQAEQPYLWGKLLQHFMQPSLLADGCRWWAKLARKHSTFVIGCTDTWLYADCFLPYSQLAAVPSRMTAYKGRGVNTHVLGWSYVFFLVRTIPGQIFRAELWLSISSSVPVLDFTGSWLPSAVLRNTEDLWHMSIITKTLQWHQVQWLLLFQCILGRILQLLRGPFLVSILFMSYWSPGRPKEISHVSITEENHFHMSHPSSLFCASRHTGSIAFGCQGNKERDQKSAFT